MIKVRSALKSDFARTASKLAVVGFFAINAYDDFKEQDTIKGH